LEEAPEQLGAEKEEQGGGVGEGKRGIV